MAHLGLKLFLLASLSSTNLQTKANVFNTKFSNWFIGSSTVILAPMPHVH